jgi:FkbM family methyltransferase
MPMERFPRDETSVTAGRVGTTYSGDPRCAVGRVSFSQEGEDLLFLELLYSHRRRHGIPQMTSGTYVDIGAFHPTVYSNTYLLYLLNWVGVNVEPTPGAIHAFARVRPRDKNIECAVGRGPSARTLFLMRDPQMNTFSPTYAKECVDRKYTEVVGHTTIPCVSLAKIFRSNFAPGDSPTLLNVDVEGDELEVLASNDWNLYRPIFVAAEVFNGESISRQADDVKALLESNGYAMRTKGFRTSFFERSE